MTTTNVVQHVPLHGTWDRGAGPGRGGRPRVRAKPLNLLHLVSAAVECNRTLLERGGIAVEQDLGAQPCWVWGGDSRLLQVLALTIAEICRPGVPWLAIHIDALPSEPGFVTILLRGVPPEPLVAAPTPPLLGDHGDRTSDTLLDTCEALEPHCGRMNLYRQGNQAAEIVLTLPLYHALLLGDGASEKGNAV